MLDYFFRDEPVLDPKAKEKFLVPASAAHLEGLAEALSPVEPGDGWTEAALEARVQAWLAEKGLEIKEVAQPARVALTGRTASPGLFQVLAALGKGAALARLKEGARRARSG